MLGENKGISKFSPGQIILRLRNSLYPLVLRNTHLSTLSYKTTKICILVYLFPNKRVLDIVRGFN
jgi:hypothetical protein